MGRMVVRIGTAPLIGQGTQGMKLGILFVDDDPNILQALQRMLRGQRAEWDMSFCDSPVRALALLEQRHFDVVVSDMRMPDLDGADLLSQVERAHPGTLRVVLSGYSEKHSIFRSIGPAHQYLAKPCSPELILTLMERALAMRRILADEHMRRLASGLRTLPSLPDLYLPLTRAMEKDSVTVGEIADLVGRDVAMTAELLKITNSAFFALGAHMTTAEQAVKLLGMETVRNLVLVSGIFRQYEAGPGQDKLRALSGYSLQTGQLARQLALENGENSDLAALAQCAGMMSVIRALVLFDAFGSRYGAAVAEAGPETLEDCERRTFGASHCELGAYLLSLWGFPDAVVEAVLYALRPSALGGGSRMVTSYLHLARALGADFPLPLKADRCCAVLDEIYTGALALRATVNGEMVLADGRRTGKGRTCNA